MFDAGRFVGCRPKDHQIYEFMGAESVLHLGGTLALAHFGAPEWALRTWELTTIGIDAGTVAHNASIGLKARF